MTSRPTQPKPSSPDGAPLFLLHAALIVLLGVAAYANTFQAPFELDDNRRMLDLPFVRTLRYFTDWPLFQRFSALYDFRLRFVGYLTFALNYAVGGDSVAGYHVVNLAIHLANALLVYALVRVTLRTPFFSSAESGVRSTETQSSELKTQNFVPLFAALLFVAHPMQTGAVTYVVQRLASLATLFFLAALLSYVRARQALEAEGWRGRALRRYGASLACAVLAMKTKEIAFTLPLAITLYELVFLRGGARRRIACLGPLLLTMAIIPLTILSLHGTAPEPGTRIGALAKASTVISRSDYLVTEMRVIVTYVRLLFLPVHQNFLYDYPVFHSLFAPQVFLSLLFLLALLGLAGWLIHRSRFDMQGSRFEVRGSRGETQSSELRAQNSELYRLIGFGILWFFLTLSVESSLIPIDDVIFEHRLYLPSVGAFIAMAAWLELLRRRCAVASAKAARAVAAAGFLAVLVLAGAAYARNSVWGSEESLWRDVVRKSPGRALGYQYLGLALAEKGDIDGAFASFNRSLAIEPELAEGYINRGTLYAKLGRYDEAAADFRRSVALDPDFAESWSNLGLVCSELGDQDKALYYLRRAVAVDPGNAKAHYNMGVVLSRQGLAAEAIGHYDRAIALQPAYEKAYVNRGIAYARTGLPDRAVEDLTQALALDPADAVAYVQRGELLARAGRRGEAAADFTKACEQRDEEGCRRLRTLTGR